MFGTILKAINSYFRKGLTFCRSIYVKKVMKLLAFIFEQRSYYSIKQHLQTITILLIHNYYSRECSGSMVECLTRDGDRGFGPHRRHCVVVLEQDTFILA